MCMEKEPMRIGHVEVYSQILLNLAYEAVEDVDYRLAVSYLNQLYGISEYLERLRLERSRDLNIKHTVDFTYTESLRNDYIQGTTLDKWIKSQ